jgi:hypothetical protein
MANKYLVVRPKYGLCNQLYSISKGIIIGILSKRNVIFSNFQMDFRYEDNLCNFEDVIDMIHLQNILDDKYIEIKVFANNDIKDIPKINTHGITEKIPYIKDFIDLLFKEDNIKEEYLDIDNPISAQIPTIYHELEKHINAHIKFTNKYIQLANNVKKCLNLTNYNCIHIRLEDDSINYMKNMCNTVCLDIVNDIYKNKYIDQLNILSQTNKNIYTCTGLGINNNINNQFYEELKEKYKLLDKNMYIDIQNNYRELFAIIDYIIATDSEEFIGSDWSSFSLYIYNHHILNNKKAYLIDIWKTVV